MNSGVCVFPRPMLHRTNIVSRRERRRENNQSTYLRHGSETGRHKAGEGWLCIICSMYVLSVVQDLQSTLLYTSPLHYCALRLAPTFPHWPGTSKKSTSWSESGLSTCLGMETQTLRSEVVPFYSWSPALAQSWTNPRSREPDLTRVRPCLASIRCASWCLLGYRVLCTGLGGSASPTRGASSPGRLPSHPPIYTSPVLYTTL